MKTTLAFVLVALIGCKGKEAAKEQPAAKAAEPPPAEVAKPAEPATEPAKPAAPAKPVAGPIVASEDFSAKCVGFVNDGAGAYVVTKSFDGMDVWIELHALGTAENPNLKAENTDHDDSKLEPGVAKINAFLAGKTLSPCSEWKPKSEKSLSAQIGGKDLTVTAKDGGKLIVAVKGGKKIERNQAGGLSNFYVDRAFSSPDFNSVAVVVNATGEGTSLFGAEWIAANDLN